MKISKEKSIAMVVTVLFFAAATTAVIYQSDNKSLSKLLDSEKLKSEKMLSQKLSLEKDIEKLKASIKDYQGKNKNLDGKLVSLNQQLAKKETELQRIANQRISDASKYKKQIDELTAMRSQLQDQLNSMTAYADDMKRQNGDLNSKIAGMQAKSNSMNERNQMLSEIVGNNYLMEAQKKSGKLTVNAKKTKEVVVGFDVPAHMASNLTINVTNPEGVKSSNRNSKTISYRIDDNLKDELLLASITNTALTVQDSKRVAIKYLPEEKFKSGVYKVDIYYLDQYLGSSQIRLK